jgi:hypothetical protein
MTSRFDTIRDQTIIQDSGEYDFWRGDTIKFAANNVGSSLYCEEGHIHAFELIVALLRLV